MKRTIALHRLWKQNSGIVEKSKTYKEQDEIEWKLESMELNHLLNNPALLMTQKSKLQK